MAKKLTLEDLIIEEHPGGQNCRNCPLYEMLECECISTYSGYSELKADLLDELCFTHTITLKPTPDAHI